MAPTPVLGASQGRVLASEDGNLQCFPQNSWRDEFFAASKLGLQFIELLVERQHNENNPFWSKEGREEMKGMKGKKEGMEGTSERKEGMKERRNERTKGRKERSGAPQWIPGDF